MKRSLSISVALLVAVACADRSPVQPPAGPQMAISDAAHGAGNPDFFFLPPMVPNPSGDPNFEAGAFNPALSPVVEVCRWASDACAEEVVAQFSTTGGTGSETIQVSPANEQYAVNWHTDASNVDASQTYRVRVLVGSQELGYADLDVVESGRDLRNVNTGEYIGLLDGRTLPIKFRIEDGALCDPPGSERCASETIVLADGGNVVIPETGDRVDIPAQEGTEQAVTVTVQYCDGIHADFPVFGNCVTVTADPPLAEPLFPPAVVSVCSLGDHTGLSEAQEGLVTLHRRDGDLLTALPHVADFCPEPVGAAPVTGLRGLALAGWRAVARGIGKVMGGKRLYAALPLLDRGGGGETEAFSDFQFGLPAQMAPLPNTDGQTVPPGDSVPYPPGVMVTDLNGDPVSGATVHFQVTQGNGSVVPAPSDSTGTAIVTDSSGIAMVINWYLGNPGPNQLRAWAVGIAGPNDSGPFMPEGWPTDSQVPTAVDTGEVFFNATAIADCDTIFLATFGADTVNLPPGPPEVGSWSLFQSAGTIRVRSALGTLTNQPVEIDQTAGLTGGVSLVGTVAGAPPTTGVYRADWQSLISSSDVFFIPIVLRDASGLIIASLEYRPGGLLTYNGFTDTIPGIPWTQDTAQAFSIFVDLDSNTTSLFINGAAVAGFQGVPFVQAAANLSRIAVETGGIDAQQMAWDNIMIGCVPGVPTPGGSVSLDSVHLNTDTLTIGGPAAFYTAFIGNAGAATVPGVVLQGWIDQAAASRAAGGLVVTCGGPPGDVPPGTCAVSFTLLASNGTAGTGTLVPGPATARWELLQSGAPVDTFTLPVLLVDSAPPPPPPPDLSAAMHLLLPMISPGAEFPNGYGDTDWPGFRNFLEITLAVP